MGAEHHHSSSSSAANADRATASRLKSSAKHCSSSWLQPDPEMRRKKRVAKYKAFTSEANIKQTVRDGCRWIKEKYLVVRYGWF